MTFFLEFVCEKSIVEFENDIRKEQNPLTLVKIYSWFIQKWANSIDEFIVLILQRSFFSSNSNSHSKWDVSKDNLPKVSQGANFHYGVLTRRKIPGFGKHQQKQGKILQENTDLTSFNQFSNS